MHFKLWLLSAIFFTIPSSLLLAFEAKLSVPAIPYEVLTISSKIEPERFFRGELEGYPHMYEFTLGEEQVLTVKVMQKEASLLLPLSLIIVKANDNNRGVAEVGRVSGKDTTTWLPYEDSRLGFSILQGETFTTTLGSGVYRMEVSTPENVGKYMLMIGTTDNPQGYFATVADIYRLQSFFGLPFLTIFLSSYVFYPFGVILLLGLMYLTWRYKKPLNHA